ncbi:GNAT family N-acetyltransferase [Sphingosinicella sp. CPCC 101087]|uniref:GNAT family N-acetyltransferase n=1 Tax=Sphingosinicella sp. CPCC 101087 TaxID=2497754 RepID=UPI00101CF0F4|nr:GNAT family N-acetyltransferase [Sphingosinicella sp. CPCC 101087]
MSAEDDALREMAANRGCKLVKSRRRTPGGDFGRYGLKDAKSGKEVMGFGGKGLTASAEEIEAFLRGGAEASWKSSLRTAGDRPPPRKRAKPSGPKPVPEKSEAADGPQPEPREARPKPPAKAKIKSKTKAKKPAKPPKAPPPPVVREARAKDSSALAALITGLGYDVDDTELRRRLKRLRNGDEPPLVADLDGVVGCLTWHVTPVLHRPHPVGRITMLVVAEASRGSGIGRRLLEAAETRLRERGCGLVEVTSNMKRMRAHGFYERAGYERTSYRFAKELK